MSGAPQSDKYFTNLTVSKTAVLNHAVIGSLQSERLFLNSGTFGLVPTSNFTLTNNSSQETGNFVQISFSGIIPSTINISVTSQHLFDIPSAFAPPNDMYISSWTNSSFGPNVIVIKIGSSGRVETCPVAAFPSEDFTVSGNVFYMI
jgi:hypothetical protein